MIRVGVVGCGYWGPNLIRNFSKIETCQMVTVCDCQPERLREVVTTYPGLQTTTNFTELVERPDIDALAIATPVSTHFRLASEALRRGKHVLIEKPMTTSVQEAEQLIELADEHGRVLMVDHTFVYTGAVRTIREVIDRGELGDLLYFDSVRANLGLFQHDVNVLWDLAPHDFSIMDYVIDEKPRAVSATGASHFTYNGHSPENIVYVTTYFASGAIAHFNLNWLTPIKVRRTLIGGTNKMIVYDDLNSDEKVKIYEKGVQIDTPTEAQEALVQYRIGDINIPVIPQHEPLERVVRAFIECADSGGRPTTDGQSGLRVLRLLEAATRSLCQSGKLIELCS